MSLMLLWGGEESFINESCTLSQVKSSLKHQGTVFEATHCHTTELSGFSPNLDHKFTVYLKETVVQNFFCGQVGQRNENKNMYGFPDSYKENEISAGDVVLRFKSQPHISDGRE